MKKDISCKITQLGKEVLVVPEKSKYNLILPHA